jgi:hypothetical protein
VSAAGLACVAAFTLAGCGELDRARQDAYEVGKSVDDPVRRAEEAAQRSAESIEQLQGQLEGIQP